MDANPPEWLCGALCEVFRAISSTSQYDKGEIWRYLPLLVSGLYRWRLPCVATLQMEGQAEGCGSAGELLRMLVNTLAVFPPCKQGRMHGAG